MREHEPHIDSLARSVEYHKRQLAEERARLGRRRRLIPVWLRMPVLKDGERKKRGRILIAIGWIMVIAVSLIVGFSQYIRSDGNLFRSSPSARRRSSAHTPSPGGCGQ